jgi:hypothetical protein
MNKENLQELGKVVFQRMYELNWFDPKVIQQMEGMEIYEELSSENNGHSYSEKVEVDNKIKLRLPEPHSFQYSAQWREELMPFYQVAHKIVGHKYFDISGGPAAKTLLPQLSSIIKKVEQLNPIESYHWLTEEANKHNPLAVIIWKDYENVVEKIERKLLEVPIQSIASEVSIGVLPIGFLNNLGKKVEFVAESLGALNEDRANFMTYLVAANSRGENWRTVQDLQVIAMGNTDNIIPFFDTWYMSTDKKEAVRRLANFDFSIRETKE